jgi:hypothetical protein
LINLVVNTGHAMDTPSSKDKRLVVRDLVHDVESSELDPPPNGGAVINHGDVGPEAMDELFGLHPREIRHVFTALKSQLSARLVVLQQECKRVIKMGKWGSITLSKNSIFKFSFNACWSVACLAALSSFSTAALEDAWSFSCHAGPICEEIRGLAAAVVGSGRKEEGGFDEDDAPAWPTGEDGNWSIEEEGAGEQVI